MPQWWAIAIEPGGLVRRNGYARLDEFKEIAIRRLLEELVGFVANSKSLAPLDTVSVIVEDFFEWTAVDHSLITLEAGALFAFEGLDGYRAKIDAAHRPPGLRVHLEN